FRPHQRTDTRAVQPLESLGPALEALAPRQRLVRPDVSDLPDLLQSLVFHRYLQLSVAADRNIFLFTLSRLRAACRTPFGPFAASDGRSHRSAVPAMLRSLPCIAANQPQYRLHLLIAPTSEFVPRIFENGVRCL